MGLSLFFKNLFGSAKETSNELVTKAEAAAQEIKETATPYFQQAETFAEEKLEELKQAAEPFLDKAEKYADQAKDLVQDYTEKASNLLGNVSEKENATEAIKTREELVSNTMKIVSDEIETNPNPASEETDDLKKE